MSSRKNQRSQLSPQVEAAISSYLAELQRKLDAIAARDASTPPWLLALRQYIDAAIDHKLAEIERDESGYAVSDIASKEHCEALWSEVVTCAQGAPSRDHLHTRVSLQDIAPWCLTQNISKHLRAMLTDSSCPCYTWTLADCLIGYKEPYPVKRNALQDVFHEVRTLIQRVPKALLIEKACSTVVDLST